MVFSYNIYWILPLNSLKAKLLKFIV